MELTFKLDIVGYQSISYELTEEQIKTIRDMIVDGKIKENGDIYEYLKENIISEFDEQEIHYLHFLDEIQDFDYFEELKNNE